MSVGHQRVADVRAEIDRLPGLKQRELKPCYCGKGVGHAGGLVFYRVRVEQFILDPRAVTRQHGLEQMLGSPALAMAMGPDEDLAKRMQDRETLVCADCAARLPVLAFLEGDND